MNKNILIGGIIAVVIVGGIVFFTSQKPQSGTTNNPQTQAENSSEGKIIAGYTGKAIAGTTSPYLIFNKTDYDKALSSGKVVFLDFYANWCPVCREEAPALKEGFDSLKTDKIVGFRVNWNDTDTDMEEKTLASDLSIAQQHTKVILKNGKEVTRTLEQWDKETFLKTLGDISK